MNIELKKRQRRLSLLLALVFAFSLAVAPVWAETVEETAAAEETAAVEESVEEVVEETAVADEAEVEASTDDTEVAEEEAEPRRLGRNNWTPAVHAALTQMIQTYGVGGAEFKPEQHRYVVFDFDNTSVINDVQEALLIYQIENLRFAIDPENMVDVLATGIPDVDQSFGEDYNDLTVAIVAEDIAADYLWLYENYEGFAAGGTLDLAAIHESNEYLDFRASFASCMMRLTTRLMLPLAILGDVSFAGMTPEEVRALAKESHSIG